MSDEADAAEQTCFFSGGEKTLADENTGMLWVGVNTKWMGVSPIHEGYYLNMWQLRRAAPAQTQEGYVWSFDDSLQSSAPVGVWIVGPEDNSQVIAGHTYEFMVGIRGCAQVPFDRTAGTSMLSPGPIGGIDPPPDEWHAAGSVLIMGSTFVDRIELNVDPTG